MCTTAPAGFGKMTTSPSGPRSDGAMRPRRRWTSSSPETVFVPYEEAYGPGFEDIKYRVPDINKLRKLTGYAPTLSIDEILERVIEYTRPRLSSRAPQGRGDLSVTPSSRA